MSLEKVRAFFLESFPHTQLKIEEVGNKKALVRHPIGTKDLRPRNTVSGPLMMMVADSALYIAILGEIGLVPLAVTTNLNINFLRRPSKDSDVIAECQLLKVCVVA